MAAHPRTIARLEARILERAAHAVEFELRDPRSCFITITRVELAHDLSFGKIFYTVLGGRGDRTKAERMLVDAAGYLQRQIGRVLRLRRIPHLRWVYDDAIEYAAEMDEKIDAALARDEEIHSGGQPPVSAEAEDWEKEYESFQEEDPA